VRQGFSRSPRRECDDTRRDRRGRRRTAACDRVRITLGRAHDPLLEAALRAVCAEHLGEAATVVSYGRGGPVACGDCEVGSEQAKWVGVTKCLHRGSHQLLVRHATILGFVAAAGAWRVLAGGCESGAHWTGSGGADGAAHGTSSWLGSEKTRKQKAPDYGEGGAFCFQPGSWAETS
jgi:hypothetical protein